MQKTGVSIAENNVAISAEDLERKVQSVVTESQGTTRSRLKWYETTARYVLGLIFLFGAVDGALYLLFGIYMHGKPREAFLIALEEAKYFWVFLKLIQSVGAVSLLFNYKPALGVALLMPIASVMCLFYVFDYPRLILLGFIIAISMIVLCRAYYKSYAHIFDNY
jgi:hypothetical protein